MQVSTLMGTLYESVVNSYEQSNSDTIGIMKIDEMAKLIRYYQNQKTSSQVENNPSTKPSLNLTPIENRLDQNDHLACGLNNLDNPK